jgi:hypothetical protein
MHPFIDTVAELTHKGVMLLDGREQIEAQGTHKRLKLLLNGQQQDAHELLLALLGILVGDWSCLSSIATAKRFQGVSGAHSLTLPPHIHIHPRGGTSTSSKGVSFASKTAMRAKAPANSLRQLASWR